MYLHQAIASRLGAHSIDRVFGLIGDANLFLVDTYMRDGHGEFIAVRNEANAVLAAIGYARLSGRTGVATVTHGPAVSNTVTALLEAARARVPVVLLAGETATDDPDNLQAVDQRAIAAAAETEFIDLEDPDNWAEAFDRAMERAQERSGPVLLNLHVDHMWQTVQPADGPHVSPPGAQPEVSDEDIEDAVGLLAAAKRPIIIAGRGVSTPEGKATVAQLAEASGAALMTTIGAKDLYRDHPQNAGVFGGLADARGAETIQAADAILALGCGLNNFTTERGALTQNKNVLAINTDPTRSGSSIWQPRTISAHAIVLAARAAELWVETELPAANFGSSVAGKAEEDVAGIWDNSDQTIDLISAYKLIDELLPQERVLVTDGGRFLPLAWQNLHVDEPRKLVPTIHIGAIGHGIGHAIGAATAEPELPTLVVVGDGGLQLGGLQELTTLATLQAPVIVVVVNDGGYGAEFVQLERRGMDTSSSLVRAPDFAGMAQNAGGEGTKVTTLAELKIALQAVHMKPGLQLIDLVVDIENVPNLLPH